MDEDALLKALEKRVSNLTDMAEIYLASARKSRGWGDTTLSYYYVHEADGVMDFVKEMANHKMLQISDDYREKMFTWEKRLNTITDELEALLVS